VSEIELKRETSSGLSLPDTTELETPCQGKVISLSEEITFDNVRIGSEVVYPKHAGMEIILENEKYRILEKEDVLAVILEQ
jgi:co-chaperonin GroES (HSP10)